MWVSRILLNANTMPYLPMLFSVKEPPKPVGVSSHLLLSSTCHLFESELYWWAWNLVTWWCKCLQEHASRAVHRPFKPYPAFDASSTQDLSTSSWSSEWRGGQRNWWWSHHSRGDKEQEDECLLGRSKLSWWYSLPESHEETPDCGSEAQGGASPSNDDDGTPR
jgi:hypothetical protein